MDKSTQSRLHGYLDELRLTTTRKRYSDIAQKARKDIWGYEEYLLSVVQEESETRRAKRIERLLRQSGLPLEKSLDTFELKRLPNKVRQQLNVLLEGRFLDYSENILIFGNPGSGKTHLICAVGQELIRQDKRVYFITCALLLQELLAAKRDLKLPKLFKKLNHYHAIIIDDIGYVHQAKEEMEVLFTLLAQRYEQGSVMITSNLPFSKWEKIFKDPVMTAAAIDRIVHHSIILELNIPSYRMAMAKNRKIQERR
ncbi:MAG: IS21-like element helper ATPase IstB [Candidatus Kaelpia imicola]|nr:IS21-like element helper ATPase IstB [Candidatus Kaelpia imicola]